MYTAAAKRVAARPLGSSVRAHEMCLLRLRSCQIIIYIYIYKYTYIYIYTYICTKLCYTMLNSTMI